jgi:hypothetical protein
MTKNEKVVPKQIYPIYGVEILSSVDEEPPPVKRTDWKMALVVIVAQLALPIAVAILMYFLVLL